MLINGRTVCHDLFFANETVAEVYVADFDYGTIKDLIEFTYIGHVKQEALLEQLMMAADKVASNFDN